MFLYPQGLTKHGLQKQKKENELQKHRLQRGLQKRRLQNHKFIINSYNLVTKGLNSLIFSSIISFNSLLLLATIFP